MGLMPFWSLLTSPFNELLKVLGDFVKQLICDAGRHFDRSGKDARQNATQMTERAGSINSPNGIRFKSLFSRQIHGQGIEVVAHHLGADILAGSEPSEAGSVFEV